MYTYTEDKLARVISHIEERLPEFLEMTGIGSRYIVERDPEMESDGESFSLAVKDRAYPDEAIGWVYHVIRERSKFSISGEMKIKDDAVAVDIMVYDSGSYWNPPSCDVKTIAAFTGFHMNTVCEGIFALIHQYIAKSTALYEYYEYDDVPF